MGLVLYRKHRPQRFSEVLGQEHVIQTLENAISSGVISHAYLFSGPRGSGKTTLARLMAKALNCQNRKEGQFEPCNNCPSCLEIMEGKSLDLIEIDAASHRGIDDIRELRDGIKFAPTKEKYKIFILDEAHQLTKEAVNALLKILEEPPSHAIFIMATTEIHKMIPTIISRCQRFDFKKLALSQIVSQLEMVAKKENAKIDKSALEVIALNSGGAVRDALSLLDQTLTFFGATSKENTMKAEDVKSLLGIVDANLVGQFVDFVADKKSHEAVQLLNNSISSGYDPQEFAKATINYLRQAMLIKINPEYINTSVVGLTSEEQGRIKMQTEKFKIEELRKIISLFIDAESKMKYSSIVQLPLELAIVDASHSEA